MPSQKLIDKVWEKGKEIRGKDTDAWRRDAEGNKIRKGSYGTQGEFGWEIDHKKPVERRQRRPKKSPPSSLGRESQEV